MTTARQVTTARQRTSAALALLAAAVVAWGCTLRWYSTYAGLHTARGTTVTSGRAMLALAAVLAVAALARLVRPGALPRLALAAAGTGVALLGAYLVAGMVAALRAFRADPFLFGQAGPGVWVVAGGAALALVAALLSTREAAVEVVDAPATASRTVGAGPAAAAALLLASAVVHLAVAPEHFHAWTAYGVFFVVCALAQLAAALLVLVRPTPALWRGVAVASAAVVVLWVVTRTSGLPFGPDRGQAEALGYADVFSSATEVAVAVLAAALARGARPLPALRSRLAVPAQALAGLALSAATVLAVLEGTGALSTAAHVH